jgi:hypothetical protein
MRPHSARQSTSTSEVLGVSCLARRRLKAGSGRSIAVGREGEVTLTSLQLLLNKMAEGGYCKSGVGQIRTYIKACFEPKFSHLTTLPVLNTAKLQHCPW